ncbi:Uncharacterised protein [uncultured archaeon]|nr:Uncharacterised protein [uncultured archaeon]
MHLFSSALYASACILMPVRFAIAYPSAATTALYSTSREMLNCTSPDALVFCVESSVPSEAKESLTFASPSLFWSALLTTRNFMLPLTVSESVNAACPVPLFARVIFSDVSSP